MILIHTQPNTRIGGIIFLSLSCWQVIEFCAHYKEDPMNEIEKPLKSANMHDVVQEWYAKFVEVQQETLFELILAANYMDIKPLLDLTCATVASMIKVCVCVYC